MDTLTFEKETTTQAAVTLINNELKNISLDNNSRGYEVEEAIRVALDNAKLYGMEASVHNFAIVPAQGETLGSATGTILLTNYNDDARPTVSIHFNLSVSKAETSGDDGYDKQHENLYNAMDVIEEAINKLNISNNTTEDEIKNAAQNALTQNNIPVTIGTLDFDKYDATETNIGYINYKIELTDSTNNLKDYDKNSIDLDTEATAKVRKAIKDYLDKLVPSNSMNENDILDGVIKAVNATGDPLTGWQKDNTGWTYMSQSTGAMQTGWAQVGGSWYYLKNNGYMSTGWVQDGNTWYYCNADGSMASNTTIDGYTLGSNGAWIR